MDGLKKGILTMAIIGTIGFLAILGVSIGGICTIDIKCAADLAGVFLGGVSVGISLMEAIVFGALFIFGDL